MKKERLEEIKAKIKQEEPVGILTSMYWLVAMLTIFMVGGWGFGFWQYLQQDIEDVKVKQEYCTLAEYFCMRDSYEGECKYSVAECSFYQIK